MNTPLTQDEIEMIKEATEQTWDEICSEIRNRRGGEYPPDWWEKIVMGGIALPEARWQ
jgi:hypothetical protein